MSHNGSKIWGLFFGALTILIAAAAIMLIFTSDLYDVKTYKAGCVLSGSINEVGWSKNNYDGIRAACAENGVQLLIRENVPEEKQACEDAVSSLIAEGCSMIFLTSYAYSENASEIIVRYPEVAFFANNSYQNGKNMTYYFGRMYQGRYLTGITAGMMTSTNRIGYVAAMPNNEVNRGINAFTLGVRSVNPTAEIHVIFTNSWDDADAETAAVKRLIDEGADIITYHQNQDNVPKYCESAGVDYISYHDMSGSYSEHRLTGIKCNWQTIYDRIIHDFLRGDIDFSIDYWLGFSENGVELMPFSDKVPEEIRARVNASKDEITGGKAVFSGEIRDNEGSVRCGANERLSDLTIIRDLYWFAEGVVIDED